MSGDDGCNTIDDRYRFDAQIQCAVDGEPEECIPVIDVLVGQLPRIGIPR